jgi:NAD(P)-dependent dehydrogenase (short-subunit alcohol dehydrogenase family)
MFGSKRSRQASAVVTGAGSGIGRAFAAVIAERGGRVICADIDEDQARETAGMVEANGGDALAVHTDVRSLESVQALAERATDWCPEGVNLVVNNAGVGVGGTRVGEIPIEDWRWTIDVNLWGVVHGCHVFAPLLRDQASAGIINVGSTASFAAGPGMGPYNVSKAGVLALTETLAAEMSGTGVHVTALCPTWVKTNIARAGRITGEASSLADRMIERGWAPEKVVKQTLDALDRDQLYVVPQLDARTLWRAKRWVPQLYARGLGLLGRRLGNERG